jgi:hypothetical protein
MKITDLYWYKAIIDMVRELEGVKAESGGWLPTPEAHLLVALKNALASYERDAKAHINLDEKRKQ